MKIDETQVVVTIYNAAQAQAAAKAAKDLNISVVLLSAPAAAASMGAAWFLALISQTRERYPDADIQAALDCADYAGYAMAALREGMKTVIFNGPAFNAVNEIAKQFDARVLKSRPENLDARLVNAKEALADAFREEFISFQSTKAGTTIIST